MSLDYFNNLESFNDEKFLVFFEGTKKGTLSHFKKELKQAGYLAAREKLNDLHVMMFNDALEYKTKESLTWDNTFRTVIDEYREFLDGYEQYKAQ